MRDEYLNCALLSFVLSNKFDELFEEGWVEDDRYQELADAAIISSFDRLDQIIDPAPLRDMFFEIFNELIENGAIEYEGDNYVTQYFRLDPTRKKQILTPILNKNLAYQRLQKLGSKGSEAFPKAVDAALREFLEGSNSITLTDQPPSTSNVPASDRTVTLNHNQVSEFDQQTTAVIKHVEELNGIGEESGLRELVLGQLKAGRELLRAGSFRVYFLQITLIDTLLFLAKRYEKETIGGLAGALAAALLKNLGIET